MVDIIAASVPCSRVILNDGTIKVDMRLANKDYIKTIEARVLAKRAKK